MNGAEIMLRSLVSSGIDVCFTNPGTSEMHAVAALDRVPEMRGVLGLFEGVVTGAADGYARIAGKPAATLLHLGPGLANGLANIHNARRAASPMVNIVGDHALEHRKFDAPLTSDIEALARPMSAWVRTSRSVNQIAVDTAEAVRIARSAPGRIATLVLPADTSWSLPDDDTHEVETPSEIEGPIPVKADVVESVAAILKSDGETSALMLGGAALLEPALTFAGRIQAATECRLFSPTFNARTTRGAGHVRVEKLPYFGEAVVSLLHKTTQLILAGAPSPVSFFAYPDKPSDLVPAHCQVYEAATSSHDLTSFLSDLADELDAPSEPGRRAGAQRPPLMSGDLNPGTIAAALGHLLPEHAIVVDEGATSSFALGPMTEGAPSHDWLDLTGGSIGQALPVSTGAAIAAPDRKVVCLSGDGGAMYTIQSLWTQARENLDIVTVIFANRAYAILNVELGRVGVEHDTSRAKELFSLDRPELNFAEMAQSMGVPAKRVETTEAFNEVFAERMKAPGPFLIEAMIDPIQLG
ncbi:MAG: acetolactate synthase large subunit [Pseudomonadota bacterium]